MAFHLMAGEGVSARSARQPACRRASRCDPIRREHRALIGSSIGHYGRSFLVQPDRHAARVWILQHALERKKAAAGHDRGPDLLVAIPAIDAAMRVKILASNSFIRSLHQTFSSASVHAGCFNPAGSIGSFRSRLPVAAKIAFAIAGMIADVPGSPMPPGASLFLTICTSITGASLMRTTW